uniref:FlgD Ig-like domain-containing protein n=1 Tax=Eiseniibacteriota bacterium TaxID=2212470 RepID=A0A832MKP1_UNCEI
MERSAVLVLAVLAAGLLAVVSAPRPTVVGADGRRAVVASAAVLDPGGRARAVRARFAVEPRPAAGDVRFTWSGLAGRGRAEIFDESGARRWAGAVDASTGDFAWVPRDRSGRALPPGLYLARVTAGERTLTARFRLR